MVRRKCWPCEGSGRVTTFWDMLCPTNWFQLLPATKRCPYCNGKGYVWQEWKDRPPLRRWR
jgi:DnaJ-class molecular chaperone